MIFITASNTLNADRVLLTRTCLDTITWVTRGPARDPPRSPTGYAGVADDLPAYGVRPLDVAVPIRHDAAMPSPVLP